MGGKRVWLAKFLFETRLIEMLSRLTAHDKLVVLNYHRIRPDFPAPSTPFDDGILSVTADQFLRQMNWLNRHARILSERELEDQIASRSFSRFNLPSVVVTFDDGYEDNYSIAFPILKALKIPAIFFVSTEMIWERKLFWWDTVAYLIKKSRKPSITIRGLSYALRDNRQKVITDLQSQLKECTGRHIREEIREISEASETDLPSAELQDRELMTQDQICEMAANQMAIGSHCHTHQALSCLDSREQEAELRVSKELLERATTQEVKSVSYPFGRYRYIPSSIQDTARKCGYRLGFTSNFGVNYHREITEMALKRFAGELDRVSTVSLIAVWPELFASKEKGFPDQ